MYDEALKDIEDGEKIISIKTYFKEYSRQKSLIYNDMALYYKTCEDYDKAIDCMNKVLEIELSWNKDNPDYRFYMNVFFIIIKNREVIYIEQKIIINMH